MGNKKPAQCSPFLHSVLITQHLQYSNKNIQQRTDETLKLSTKGIYESLGYMFGSYFRQIKFLQGKTKVYSSITVYTSKDPTRRYSFDTPQKPENKVIFNKPKPILTIDFDRLYYCSGFITLSTTIDDDSAISGEIPRLQCRHLS